MTVDHDSSLWTRRYHSAPPGRPRLVCLPHAGGSATFFFGPSRALSPAVEVLAVQYPGRQDRRHEPFITDLHELADRVHEVLPGGGTEPLALFGHSMGATLAYEIARRLEADGRTPVHLFVSGRPAPSRHRDDRLHQADDERLLAEVNRLNGTDATLLDDSELRQMVLGPIRADYIAAETYRPTGGAPLRCPVTAFCGDADPKAGVEEMLAWQTHTTGPFDLHVFPGGHFFIGQHEHAVLDLITAALGAASGAVRGFVSRVLP
ncbi:thioesterase II family protein [Dactylosporangium sp. CA-152071]|uniref:thioesterase II family protein n=1 Tax=Dactylosporangium sp. CA-152071 TaxID=3239933 RepID=UPI003D8C44AA